MITLLFILIVLVAIFSFKPDKKNMQLVNEEIQKLPKISLRGKNMTGTQKFLNLAYDDDEILNSFLYESGAVKLEMKNGKYIFAPLSEIEVRFTKSNNMIFVTVKRGNIKIEFREMAFLYTQQEWEVIYKVLSLAGRTYGADMFSDLNKNIGKVNSILKALKALQ